MASYHAIWFLAGFFIFLALAVAFILPLTIFEIVKIFKPGRRPPSIVQILIGISTSLACIFFAIAIIMVSVFSYYPYYAAALLITLFLILIFIAFKPWKPGFFKKKPNIYLIVVLVFMFIMGWVVSALTRDVCITSNPRAVSVYQTRKIKGDICDKTAPVPCHTYLMFGRDASSSVIVHYHASKKYKNPVVRFSTDGILNHTISAKMFDLELEVDRWIYYAEMNSLLPDTTYYFAAGDASDSKSFTDTKSFVTAPLTAPYTFVSGGDVGVGPLAPKLLKSAAAKRPLFMALGGDLAYDNGIRACYGRYDDFFSQYEKNAVTPEGHMIPMVAAIGNHETGGFDRPMSSSKFYKRYFVQEPLGGKNPTSLPSYHAHTIGNQVMVALDSSVVSTPKSQASWLDQVLGAAPTGSFKTAIYHAPAYPAYRAFNDPISKALRDHFVPVFDRHALTVSFENHDHVYKRTHRLKGGKADATGTLYVGDGAFGVASRQDPKPLPIPSDRPYLAQYQGRSFYFLVNVTATEYSMRAIDQFDATFDSFSNSYP